MRTRLVIAALAVPVALLSACGDDDGGAAAEPESRDAPSASETASSSPSEPSKSADPSAGWPDCTDVWSDGATLPRAYKGCRDGVEAVNADSRYCSFGRPLVVYAGRFYAVPTGTIHETAGPLKKDRGYRSALASCTA